MLVVLISLMYGRYRATRRCRCAEDLGFGIVFARLKDVRLEGERLLDGIEAVGIGGCACEMLELRVEEGGRRGGRLE